MSVITEVIAKLQEAPSPFRILDGADALAAVDGKRPETSPAAYVLIAEEAAGENERATGGHLQRLEADLAVVIITENASGGHARAEDIETLKTFVRARLTGFKPASAGEPMDFISGKLLKARESAVWVEQVFSVVTYLEAN